MTCAASKRKAGALLTEARAEVRIAGKYDLAQERRDVHKYCGQVKNEFPVWNFTSAADVDLPRKEKHKAHKRRKSCHVGHTRHV